MGKVRGTDREAVLIVLSIKHHLFPKEEKAPGSVLPEGCPSAAGAGDPLLYRQGLRTSWREVRKQKIIYPKAAESDAKFLTIALGLADQNEWEIFFPPDASIVLRLKIENHMDSFSV